MGVSDDWPQFRKDIHYSDDSKLNTLQTCIPKPTSSNDQSRIWVVYVHGGAWFDPEQTATTFDKAQDILLKSPELDHIAGFASINYRLSPASWHPTDPSNPADPARNAMHPDHINDVLSAILHLQETYRFEDRYILVGHSCGACLVMQVAMKRYWGVNYQSTQALELNVVPPLAICGIEGLYDLPALVKYHDKLDQSLYRNFTEAAFGTSEQGWAAASPTQGDYKSNWEDGKLVVIAHSREDELVEWEQPELMLSSLQKQGFTESGDRRLKLLELEGTHDQVWKEGEEVARAIEYTIKEFVSLES
ncbi:Kynurenine formamidase [Pseudocercospora fuligena]|uniref:Kynurenine formamidase n=1 Tax=Pseudocercospora fuligena TaxID=685502 RepID=A0A8H6R321_9PEZI|nr:Kynurenine formamidase [Pseudocercospora fuligena]